MPANIPGWGPDLHIPIPSPLPTICPSLWELPYGCGQQSGWAALPPPARALATELVATQTQFGNLGIDLSAARGEASGPQWKDCNGYIFLA